MYTIWVKDKTWNKAGNRRHSYNWTKERAEEIAQELREKFGMVAWVQNQNEYVNGISS